MNDIWTVQRLQRLMRNLKREAKGLKRRHKIIEEQVDLARAVGVTPETVSRWMRGHHLPCTWVVKKKLQRLEKRAQGADAEPR